MSMLDYQCVIVKCACMNIENKIKKTYKLESYYIQINQSAQSSQDKFKE